MNIGTGTPPIEFPMGAMLQFDLGATRLSSKEEMSGECQSDNSMADGWWMFVELCLLDSIRNTLQRDRKGRI